MRTSVRAAARLAAAAGRWVLGARARAAPAAGCRCIDIAASAGIALRAGWERVAQYAAGRISVRPRAKARRGGRAGALLQAVYWNTSSGIGVSGSKFRAARNSGRGGRVGLGKFLTLL